MISYEYFLVILVAVTFLLTIYRRQSLDDIFSPLYSVTHAHVGHLGLVWEDTESFLVWWRNDLFSLQTHSCSTSLNICFWQQLAFYCHLNDKLSESERNTKTTVTDTEVTRVWYLHVGRLSNRWRQKSSWRDFYTFMFCRLFWFYNNVMKAALQIIYVLFDKVRMEKSHLLFPEAVSLKHLSCST